MKTKGSDMKTKLTVAFVAVVFCLAAAPLALEQLDNLRRVGEDWTRSSFLSGILTVNAAEKEQGESPATLMAANVTQSDPSADEFHWSGRVANGDTVEIRGINGGISAEPAEGGEVVVTATKSARRSDPKSVEIRVVEHAGGVIVCAIYPQADGRAQQCSPDGGDHSNIRNNDVVVEFKVRVPRGVRFSGRTVNGDIETGPLGADVDAKTVNGSINISAAGVASAKTVNGSITARLGRADWSEELEFKTVNGGITLDLPADTNAQVTAETLNGEISTDFPLTLLGRISRRHLNGTIGSGGRELSLKSVNGSIQLRRAS
jgi:Putative adhesin